MSTLVTPLGNFQLHRYESEREFEAAVVSQTDSIFGDHRIYVDCKRRIGARGGKQSVPDAYLIDLSRPLQPQLYVVENELSTHDLFKHIGVQLLQFSVSFPQAGRLVKQVLFDEIVQSQELKERCEKYAEEGKFRNLDHFLDKLVFDCPFQALVIIDEETDELHTVLKSLGFPVEVVEFRTYSDVDGRRIHQFEPFLADVESVPEVTVPSAQSRPVSDLDTVVVPARDDGFEEVFLGENRWYAVRIHPSMARQLKYIAVYRVAPTSAITHVAPIRSIEPWKDTGKVVINFAEAAHEIGPLDLVKNGRVKPLYGLRYTSSTKLASANDLDGAF